MISVIVCSYNQENTVEETIQSILAQTYKDFEIVFVNNSSNDNTLSIASNYVSDNFTVYTNSYTGLSETRNFGVSKSRGEYILFIDGDDKIAPTFLEKSIEVLSNAPENIGFVYTDTQHFGGANTYWEQPEYNFQSLLQNNFICSCSLMRKSAFDAVNGYSKDNWGYWEDYEFWIRLGSIGIIGKHIPEKLFLYRVHPHSGMQSNRNKYFQGVYRSSIVAKFPELYPEDIYNSAKNIMSMYPEDFMTWTFAKQEDWLNLLFGEV